MYELIEIITNNKSNSNYFEYFFYYLFLKYNIIIVNF